MSGFSTSCKFGIQIRLFLFCERDLNVISVGSKVVRKISLKYQSKFDEVPITGRIFAPRVSERCS